MEKKTRDKNERLGDKNERLGEKNGYSHPLFYGSFMWECIFCKYQSFIQCSAI